MLKEKGVSGVVVVVIIGAALLIMGTSGYFIFGKKTPAVHTRDAVQAPTDAPEEIDVDSAETQSLISYDSFVYSSSKGMYYRTITPAPSARATDSSQDAPDGSSEDVSENTTVKVGSFKQIPGADPSTFSEIRKLPMKTPTGDPGASTVATYYRDDDQVFVAQTTTYESGEADTTVEPVEADPATFQILNDTYAKDEEHVYVVSWVCQGETCTLELVVVVGADPETFHVIEETTVQKNDGSGTVTADAVDSTHLFNNGVVVDTVDTPGSDDLDKTPVLISP
jgi:hypothetical protein